MISRKLLRTMSSGLEHLNDVTRLSPRVHRIMGQNPSQYTLQGTNCYLLQTPDSADSASRPRRLFLIDTGSGRPSSLTFAVLLRSELVRLESEQSSPAQVSDIILTHRHGDHIGGLPDVLACLAELGNPPPRIHKLKHPLEPPEHRDWDAELDATLPDGLYRRTADERSLHELKENQRLVLGDSNGSTATTTLRVLHTPGHTADSISLVLEEENAVFTGDTVLGQGTTIFESLSQYMRSLRLLLTSEADRLYPAHGPTIDGTAACRSKLDDYLQHRQAREDQIVGVLASGSSGGMTPMDIVQQVYAGMDEMTWQIALRPLAAHLSKLQEEGRVVAAGDNEDRRWQLVEAEHHA